jgi:Protein of unknown function (DUF1194)
MPSINVDGRKPYPGEGVRLSKVARVLGLVISIALHVLIVSSGPGKAQDCADVDLVLAIDGSGSIDAAEFHLQQHGYAAAFRRRDVQQALRDAGIVDVAVVLWGDTEIAVQVLPWARLKDPASAEDLAIDIERMNRLVQGNTGLGRALWQSLDILDEPGQCGLRKIVNVSGDGHESVSPHPRAHVPLALARQRAKALHVVVNALAIENEAADLAEWYQEQLIVGAGAFVMGVDGFDSFADAIAKKLIREIASPNVAFSSNRAVSGKT